LGAAVDPRRRLGLATDAFVLSSFGLIRPYKGFENLIKVFRNWNDESSMLHIAGEPMFPQVANELENLSAGDAHICLDLRSLTRLELRDLVYASDVIVLPYKKMMNSGVAVAALSLGCPILGPAAGCILDFHERLGPDWVLMFNDELSVDDLERARRSFRKRDRSKMPNLSWMEPDIIGENILQVYQQLTQIK
jgi:glycosyltransferase involved in cell wall biosynthesis